MSIQLHPRTQKFNQARSDLDMAVCEWIKKHNDITCAEMWAIFSGIMLAWANYAIKDERSDPCKQCDRTGLRGGDQCNADMDCKACEGSGKNKAP